MLAYHWSSALELVRAAGSDGDEMVERTRRALRAAGDRAFALNSFAVAAAQYEDALALWPEDEQRPEVLFQLARALHWSYDEARQQDALEAARDALLAVGDTDRASETESFLARAFWDRGQHDLVREHLARAETLAGDSVSAAAARVFAFSGRIREIAGEKDEGRRLAESAFAMATELGLDELRAHALTTIGMAKNDTDDPSGVADMERALDIALDVDSPISSSIVNNLAVNRTYAGDLHRTDELYADATRLDERFGDARGCASFAAIRSTSTSCAGAGTSDRVGGRVHRGVRSRVTSHEEMIDARSARGTLRLPEAMRAWDRDQSTGGRPRGGEARPVQPLGACALTAAMYAELGSRTTRTPLRCGCLRLFVSAGCTVH